MRHDHFFHFVGINVEARDKNHVLYPVHDFHVAIDLHDGDIAGAQEAISRHDCSRFLGALPVSLHDLGTAHAKFASLADRQFYPLFIADGNFGGR